MAAANKISTKIFTQHYHELKALLLGVEQSVSIVEDVLQDAFLKFHLNIDGGKDIKNPKSWLYRVSKNQLIDHYRKNKQHHAIDMDDTSVEINDHGPQDCLKGIIANLPHKYKKAVYLTDIKGISQTKSAKKLNISLSTFKSHVQRGRKLVAKGFVDCCDYEIDEKGMLRGESKDWEDCKICSNDLNISTD